MRTPPLLADFSHARACKPFCENSLTLPALAFQRSLIKAPSILIPEMLPKIFHQNKNIGGLMPPIFLSYLFAVTTGEVGVVRLSPPFASLAKTSAVTRYWCPMVPGYERVLL